MPLTVTKAQLHLFLSNGHRDNDYATYCDNCQDDDVQALGAAAFAELQKADLREIVADQHMSENHPGGDDLVAVADGVLDALAKGYAISTWYGPNTEALVVGYRAYELTIVN